MRTVIFDLDGTLADTSGDLIAAANACFNGLGHGDILDHETDMLTAFHGGRAMLRLGFARLGIEDEARVDAEYLTLLDHYEENIDRHTRLYPGALEAVETLQGAGYAVGICTNKPEGLAETLLTRLGIRDHFASLVGADTLPVRKPDPAPFLASVSRAGGDGKRAILIGDTMTDVETARAAGVPIVLVGFGPSGAEVAAMSPDAILPNYTHLSRIVAELIG